MSARHVDAKANLIAFPIAPPVAANKNGQGIALMALGMFIFAAVDSQAKLLTQTLPPLQIMWFRQLGLLFGVVILLVIHGWKLLRTEHRTQQMARGVLAATSGTLFIVAIQKVPIADAVAVSFVAPFMVTVLGALVLREKVGVRRWAAVGVGFVGTLIVIRPGSGALDPVVLLVILAAGAFALRQILSRSLGASDNIRTTVAYTALTSSALLTLPLPFVWVWPTQGYEVWLLITLAITAALGEVCVIRALQLTEAVAVAPIHYSLIVWGTFYGFMIFGDLPDMWTWIGTAIIVASGLYTIWREQLRPKRS